MELTPEELVLTDHEKANIRSAYSQIDFNTEGTHMFQLTEEQANIIEEMRATTIFTEENPGDHAEQPYITSILPQIKIVQINPTVLSPRSVD